jgi:uncharacterized membrane protein
MNKTRLEAFSDGVFAIIITIMVLEIRVPLGADWAALKPLLPIFLSYVLSFVFVGIYWGNHHHLLHGCIQVSSGIIWANMHLLFWLSLIPFITGWMGENHFATNPIILYSIVLLLCGLSFTLLQVAIEKTNPFSPSMAAAFKKVKRQGILSLFGYLASIGMAFVNTYISGLILILIATSWLIPNKDIEQAIKEIDHTPQE